MNPENHLILVKGEDKTESLTSCHYDAEKKKYAVQFMGSEKQYFYAYDAILWLREPIELNCENNRFFADGTQLFHIVKVIQFDTYFRVFFEKGFQVLYRPGKLKVLKSCLQDSKSKNLFDYFSELAKVMPPVERGTKSHLYHQFEKMGFVGNDTVLAKYLNAAKYGKLEKNLPKLIFPFGCNESQRNAVEMTLSTAVSIIEGPPGTGKTQTILNIIANLLLEGKTVAVVSNNNSATDNVYEKLQKYQLEFICAPLGNKENKEEFLEHQKPVNEMLPVMPEDVIREKREVANTLQAELSQKLTMRNELAVLVQELKALCLEEEYFKSFYDETYQDAMMLKIRKVLPSKTLLSLWTECEVGMEQRKNSHIFFWQKLKYFLWYGIGDYHFFDRTLDEVIPVFQRLYYEAKRQELENRKREIEGELTRYSFEIAIKNLTELSMEVLCGAVSQKYRGQKRRKFTKEDLWKNTGEIISQYPVVLSTTHSIRSSLPGVVYDYVIVDEASQVDLVTGFLAMSCTRNIVIVGDEKQLPNVVTDEVRKKTTIIAEGYQIPEGMEYADNSLLSSIKRVMPGVPRIILREHYRCHPKIIQFCNQKFYRNELVIMSEDKGEEDVLKVYKTVPGNHARKTVNLRQIEEIEQSILPELSETTAGEKIGIISPYRAQTEKMDTIFTGSGMAIDTVHKFQGREKEAIVITTVDNEISAFTDNPNMLNVAVSRAKKKLRLVVSDNEANDHTNIGDLIRYVSYQKGEVREGKVYSVFDLLYQDYKSVRDIFLAKHKRVSGYDSENLMYGLLEELLEEKQLHDLSVAVHIPVKRLIRDLSQLNEEEISYAMNPWTHVDLIIFRKVDKSPVLAIEVDGYENHKPGTIQHDRRDAMKDKILAQYGIPLLRCSTTGSGERKKVLKALGIEMEA